MFLSVASAEERVLLVENVSFLLTMRFFKEKFVKEKLVRVN